MSKMDELKSKIRSTSGSSVHPELIDSSTEVPTTPKPKKKKFEELHKRDTVWIENELKKDWIERAPKMVEAKKHGSLTKH